MTASSIAERERVSDIPSGDFTKAARQVIELAYQHAARRRSPGVEPEHLLMALLERPGEQASRALARLQIDPRRISQALEARVTDGRADAGLAPKIRPQTLHVVQYGAKEAQLLGGGQIDAVHLLLGLLYEGGNPAYDALQDAEVSLFDLRQALLQRPKRMAVRGDSAARRKVRPSPIFLIPVGLMVVSGLWLYLGPARLYVTPLTIAFVVSGWITSVCLHEFGHALAAYLGGDLAVKDAGYLTLNPLRYTHPLFSIVLPLLFLMTGGIGLPGGAVYVNRNALRSGRWESVMSAAGPIGTALFGLLLACPFFFDWEGLVTAQNWHFWPALAFLAFLEVTALVFNLIPLPPLDGFGIIAPRLSPALRQQAYMFGNILLLVLFVTLSQDGPIAQMFWHEVFTVARAFHIPLDLIDAGREQFFF